MASTPQTASPSPAVLPAKTRNFGSIEVRSDQIISLEPGNPLRPAGIYG